MYIVSHTVVQVAYMDSCYSLFKDTQHIHIQFTRHRGWKYCSRAVPTCIRLPYGLLLLIWRSIEHKQKTFNFNLKFFDSSPIMNKHRFNHKTSKTATIQLKEHFKVIKIGYENKINKVEMGIHKISFGNYAVLSVSAYHWNHKLTETRRTIDNRCLY